MNHWGIHAIATSQICAFNTSLCFLPFIMLGESSRRFSLLPFCYNLKIIELCQSLSNVFDISRKSAKFHGLETDCKCFPSLIPREQTFVKAFLKIISKRSTNLLTLFPLQKGECY